MEESDDDEYTEGESDDDDDDSVTDAWLSSMPDSFFDLAREETPFFVEIKPPDHLCVGYYIPNEVILDIGVLPVHFLRYSCETIRHYLEFYTMYLSNVFPRPIEIMRLSYAPNDESYRVVLKTHWLRLIQRTWKRVFAERQKQISKKVIGHIPWKSPIPSLRGMLAGIRSYD